MGVQDVRAVHALPTDEDLERHVSLTPAVRAEGDGEQRSSPGSRVPGFPGRKGAKIEMTAVGSMLNDERRAVQLERTSVETLSPLFDREDRA